FLDGELKIRWFSPAIEDLFNLRRADIGRPIGHFVPRFEHPAFTYDCRRVLETVEPAAREVAAGERWFVRRIQPYRTADERIDGVVVSFADVTALQDARLYAERIVETVPLPFLVLDTGLRVVSASPAFYTTFQARPEETEGRLLYDLGNGQWNIPELRRLLDEVLPHDEVFAGYEVTHVFESIGRKVMRLNGRRLDHVQLILLAIEDVTAERDLLDRLRESEERFRVLVDTSTHAVWETDAAGRVVADSPSWRAFTGQSVAAWRGEGWTDVVHPDDLERVRAEWRAAVATGDVVDTEFRLRRPDGGWRWTHAHAAPLHDPDGGIRKWVGMNTDISERKRAEEERELLLGELDHRVKNLFAVVRALASQFRDERSAAEERRVFLDRLDALMRSHNLALADDWRSVDLAALAREALAAYGTAADDGGVAIRGESVAISPKAAQSLALLFNELATNAVKYGALSTPAGRVELTWTVEPGEDGRRVRLSWTERGGPPVTPPARASFGTRLIERAFKSDLAGDATLAYDAEGVRLDAVFPLR
ncbi:MAG: PAS domain-containing protein, partial [Deinococcus-Thermus bacterium]|nr:PAS domain-containing protein [Deinococcota bacterium]